jgi:hypothetical protein
MSDQADEHRDELPADLDASGYVGPYKFPDNSRRRIPGIIYLGIAAGCVLLWVTTKGSNPVLVNRGFLLAALILGAVGVLSITSSWRMRVDEKDALAAATQEAGFPIGHASAQQVWRGLRSRPTWRVLAYSEEEPPKRRALVLVDAVDGHVVQALVQDNPIEDWDTDA